MHVRKPIESAEIVSDGIVVRFSDGVLTYFSQEFLREHIGVGSNQIFLDYDPFAKTGGAKGKDHLVQ
jgi:hypothetical protein